MDTVFIKPMKITFKKVKIVYVDNTEDSFNDLSIIVPVPYGEDTSNIAIRKSCIISAISILVHEAEYERKVKEILIDYETTEFSEI